MKHKRHDKRNVFQGIFINFVPTYGKTILIMIDSEKKQKGSWGGRRQGAGRKNIGSKAFPFRVAGDTAKLVEAQENKSQFVKECIEYAAKAKGLLDKDGKMVKAMNLSLVVSPAEGEILDTVELPFFDNAVAAGYPTGLGDIQYGESINISEILCPGNHPQIICPVKGESMIGARIFPGDYIVVDVSPRIPTEHDIALCEVNGEYTIKYVKPVAEGFMLIPANEKFKPVLVRPGDDFHIRGIVKSTIRGL